MAEEDLTVFNDELLDNGADVLQARPESRAVETAGGARSPRAGFGTVPGGAEAAGRIEGWLQSTRTELGRVATDVADLGGRARQAAQVARDAGPATEAVARLGTPADNTVGR